MRRSLLSRVLAGDLPARPVRCAALTRQPRHRHSTAAGPMSTPASLSAIGPRWPTGPGHTKAETFLRTHFHHDPLEEDAFTADTPIGPVNLRNFIVRYPGKKDGVIVLATHYETNYYLKHINFVGANDGAATTGLLMAIADQLRIDSRWQETRRLLRLAGLLRRRRSHPQLVRF